MKVEEKAKARDLRKEGRSVREIAKLLNVSRGSVSLWVRDIKLTEEQELQLIERNNINPGRFNGGRANRAKFLEIRKKYQEEGRAEARKHSWLFTAGCMLYWGEGFKRRNVVGIANSDPNLLKLFLNFLYTCFDIEKKEVRVALYCYPDREYSLEDIKKYWLNYLSLTEENLSYTHQINNRPISSVHKSKGRKLNYGVCRIVVCRTDVIQKIFGAIQELGNFSKVEWLG